MIAIAKRDACSKPSTHSVDINPRSFVTEQEFAAWPRKHQTCVACARMSMAGYVRLRDQGYLSRFRDRGGDMSIELRTINAKKKYLYVRIYK